MKDTTTSLSLTGDNDIALRILLTDVASFELSSLRDRFCLHFTQMILILCFDVTRRETYDSVVAALSIFYQFRLQNEGVVMIVLGTKCDLEKERKVKAKEAKV